MDGTLHIIGGYRTSTVSSKFSLTSAQYVNEASQDGLELTSIKVKSADDVTAKTDDVHEKSVTSNATSPDDELETVTYVMPEDGKPATALTYNNAAFHAEEGPCDHADEVWFGCLFVF